MGRSQLTVVNTYLTDLQLEIGGLQPIFLCIFICMCQYLKEREMSICGWIPIRGNKIILYYRVYRLKSGLLLV